MLAKSFFMKSLFLVCFFLLFWNVNSEAQVPRKVFVEHFTNTLCGPCSNRNPGFYNNLNNQNNIVHLSIYSGTPYTQCQLYQQNPSPSDARRFYYNIGGTPSLVINGFSIPTNSDYSQNVLFQPFRNQVSPISIRMEQQKYGNDSVQVRVVVKTEGNHNLGTQQLWVGVAEDTVYYTGPNGEGEHYDVYRGSLDFTSINIPMTIGDSLVYSYTAFANVNWDFDRIFAFAMLQNTGTKSVIQSEATNPSTNNLITNIQSIVEGALDEVKLYPNPTRDALNVEVESDLETNIALYSLVGKLVTEQNFQKRTSLSLKHLPAGVYMARFYNKKGIVVKKVVLE